MNDFAFPIIWLALCIWASFFVAGRIDNDRDRVVYYLLIWLVPYIGAAAAILLSRRRSKPARQTASEKMFEAIVESHQKKDSA